MAFKASEGSQNFRSTYVCSPHNRNKVLDKKHLDSMQRLFAHLQILRGLGLGPQGGLLQTDSGLIPQANKNPFPPHPSSLEPHLSKPNKQTLPRCKHPFWHSLHFLGEVCFFQGKV